MIHTSDFFGHLAQTKKQAKNLVILAGVLGPWVGPVCCQVCDMAKLASDNITLDKKFARRDEILI